MIDPADIQDNENNPVKKVRLAREHPMGIIIPRWWRNRVALGFAVVAVISVIFAMNTMDDAKDRLPKTQAQKQAETSRQPEPEAWYKSQPEPPVNLISGPEEPIFPEFGDGEVDVRVLAYEEALSADSIEDAPVIYPDATGPRVVVQEEFIPEPFVLGESVVVDDVESEMTATVASPPTPEILQPAAIQSIDPALEEVLVAISKSGLNATEATALWQQNAIAFDLLAVADRPMIAIVIDDMGVDMRRSRVAAALPGPLTLSYLTYASDLDEQTRVALDNGHELMLHVPMQPESDTVDPGPEVLRIEDSAAEVLRRLRWGLAQFDGYVGINNHMGSRFTGDLDGMRVVLAEIKSRGLLFLDSRTSGGSVATAAAHEFDVPYATRNVFLDHVDDETNVRERLIETERLARKNGSAIAIGHPRDATLTVVAEWLGTLAEKGIVLAPLSAIVRQNWKPVPQDLNATSVQ